MEDVSPTTPEDKSVKRVASVRREERIMFATILTALREHGSKSRGDLERVIEKMLKIASLTDRNPKEALESIMTDEERKEYGTGAQT